jgi:hypothetical protein
MKGYTIMGLFLILTSSKDHRTKKILSYFGNYYYGKLNRLSFSSLSFGFNVMFIVNVAQLSMDAEALI